MTSGFGLSVVYEHLRCRNHICNGGKGASSGSDTRCCLICHCWDAFFEVVSFMVSTADYNGCLTDRMGMWKIWMRSQCCFGAWFWFGPLRDFISDRSTTRRPSVFASHDQSLLVTWLNEHQAAVVVSRAPYSIHYCTVQFTTVQTYIINYLYVPGTRYKKKSNQAAQA